MEGGMEKKAMRVNWNISCLFSIIDLYFCDYISLEHLACEKYVEHPTYTPNLMRHFKLIEAEYKSYGYTKEIIKIFASEWKLIHMRIFKIIIIEVIQSLMNLWRNHVSFSCLVLQAGYLFTY